MKNNKKKGFTIVELVIVIAVIGILSAVLIPTFSNVTKKAREAAKSQELSEAVTAVLMAENGTFEEGYDYYFVYTSGNDVTYYVIDRGELGAGSKTDPTKVDAEGNYSEADASELIVDNLLKADTNEDGTATFEEIENISASIKVYKVKA